MMTNRIKAAAREGRTAFGIYITQPAPVLVDLAGQAGLDFVRIDAYHGALGAETIDGLIRASYASGLTPSIRVGNDPREILSALECGAMALTIPEVDSAEAARAVVRAARYAPRGERESSRPARTLGASREAYFRWADEELVVSVQIESLAGLDAVEEIAAVDGIDMLQSGRSDLSQALGVPGQPDHPLVHEAEARIAAAARRAGKMLSLHFPPQPGSVDYARSWIANGVECVTIGGDIQVLFAAMRERLDLIRGSEPKR
jgi:4-hydroxy-2-oxoheptanedioate aldolase